MMPRPFTDELQLNNLLIFSKSRVEEMEIRFCIQMTLVIYKTFWCEWGWGYDVVEIEMIERHFRRSC